MASTAARFGSDGDRMKPVRSASAAAAPPPGPPPSLARRWPTILVAAYAIAAFSWSMPDGWFPAKAVIDRVAAGPMLLFGLWQAWDMFSPDPRGEDICVEVRFVDRDGTTDRRMLTDMVAMGYLERWRKDRWRKYCNDHLRLDAARALWQPFAEFAVRRLREEGHDPAVVDLVRWWRPCEPALRPELRADVRRTPWQSHAFHRWAVPTEWER
jgi:hypothetical protein